MHGEGAVASASDCITQVQCGHRAASAAVIPPQVYMSVFNTYSRGSSLAYLDGPINKLTFLGY